MKTTQTRLVRGSELSPEAQREALARFVHRFTRDHKPAWAEKPWEDGKPYPVQFDSDRDWLNNTLFHVTEAGRLSNCERYCESSPTWPDNPERRNEPPNERNEMKTDIDNQDGKSDGRHMKNKSNTLQTVKSWDGEINAIGVKDTEDGFSVWWPKADAQAEIQASADPEATALEMCEQTPKRGVWKN